jgi:hypothetical protein
MRPEGDPEVNRENNVKFRRDVGDGVGANGASSCVFNPVSINQHLR